MFNLALRNIKIYLRNKTSVFLSFLGVLILFMLYILFLGDVLGKIATRQIIDSWMIAGMLSAASITTTMGAFEIIVRDKETNALKDFYTAPISRSTIVGGYLLSTIFIGFVMSIVSLILGEIYIIAYGGKLLSLGQLLLVLPIILLSVIASNSILFFLMSFIKTSSAFGTASAIIGSLIGFITGIYMPLGQFPAAIQWVVKIFPISHSAVLLRKVMATASVKEFYGTDSIAINEFNKFMGTDIYIGSYNLSPLISVLFLVVAAVIFYLLTVSRLSVKNKKGK